MVEQTAGRVPVQIDPSLPSAVRCSTVGAWRRGRTLVEIGKLARMEAHQPPRSRRQRLR